MSVNKNQMFRSIQFNCQFGMFMCEYVEPDNDIIDKPMIAVYAISYDKYHQVVIEDTPAYFDPADYDVRSITLAAAVSDFINNIAPKLYA